MNSKTNLTAPNTSDPHGIQAVAGQQPYAEKLDLYAEELPEHRDLLPISTVFCIGTIGCIGGTVGSIGTAGSL